jgi:DNA-binding protein H-NS
MSQTLQEMIAQRDALEAAIKEQQTAARTQAIDAARKFCAEHGLSADDVFPKKAKPSAPATKLPAKYADGNGNTWSGRGVHPRWLSTALGSGATLEQFRVAAAA